MFFNMTVREAMQRCEVNKASIRRSGYDGSSPFGGWFVTLIEWTQEQCTSLGYYTDDLEDAVLTAGAMRHKAKH